MPVEERSIPAWTHKRDWRNVIRRHPAIAAWPFVVVICTQMAVGGFSVYTLSAIRAFVNGESLWSKGQHEAEYFLNLYLDTGRREYLDGFRRTIAVPLSYRRGRQHLLETIPPNPSAAGRAFIAGGTAPEDIPSVLWLFRIFRGFPYLEEALAKWKEADPYLLELNELGRSVGTNLPISQIDALRNRVEQIDAEITPRAIGFSQTLDEGARLVERLLFIANFVLAGLLAGITIWRVGKVIAQRRLYETALSWQATHDELTGLVNRTAFRERLTQAVNAAKDEMPTACSLMFIDLDQFKIINDTCGHAAGDEMLRRIGPPIQDLLASNDIIARLGGDEFGILLPTTDMGRALVVAESIRAAVEQIDFAWGRRSFTVTASIGLVSDHAGAASAEELMSKADMACLMAKEKGRNRVHSHGKEDRELHGRILELNWVHRIQQALAEDRFCLYAQEIVALSETRDEGIHLECLIRMRDESGNIVPPSSFLPAAERFGLIKLIDRWVVRRAFQTLSQHRALGTAMPIAQCGINLSGATVGDDAFLGFLKGAFEEFRIPPGIVCFEVTETAAIVNLDAARSFITDLRALGCTFALDDFGSGMSSFNYLKELPVDYLKIDGAFVKNLLTDRPDRAMVEMINHVGHVMGKRIIAEFVETQDVADALRIIGIDYVQGYGIDRPSPFTPSFKATDQPVRQQTISDLRRTA